MKLFDYSKLIRVIDNVEIREEREKAMELIDLKERYRMLERLILESGILDDWSRLKKLCLKADVDLNVSHIGDSSIGRVLKHEEDFRFCSEYGSNGAFCKWMSSGSHWSDYYGFVYQEERLIWKTYHTSNTHIFEGFGVDEQRKYETQIYLLEKFRDTYEIYRDFQLKKIEKKFEKRIKVEDI